MGTRAAIGIVRVSRRAGRKGESFISPTDQRNRIAEACEQDGLALQSVAEEIDVSGGTSLDKREGLREAIEAVESGSVQVVVVGYFDRLFRSLKVQAEVVSRVEAAGGEVLALDFGRVSEGSAAEWLSGTMMGAFAEYQRRSGAERSHAAQETAVGRGVPPFGSIPPGLRKRADKTLEPDEDAPLIVEAFQLRAGGATIAEVRKFLTSKGIKRTYRGVQSLLASPLYLGEIRFGELVNPAAHEPIVPRQLWEQVQRVKVARGRRPKSERLLARLGILRCGTCGARMVVGSSHYGQYPLYRCIPTSDCERRVSISAELVERVVVEAVKEALADVVGRASVEANAREAEHTAESAQEKLDAAIRAFADFKDEPAAQETLIALRDERDEAVELVEQLGGKRTTVAMTVEDWDSLTLGERRDLIRATIERVDIGPGRGAGRISVQPFV